MVFRLNDITLCTKSMLIGKKRVYERNIIKFFKVFIFQININFTLLFDVI
jgi:hypothetical protein